MPWQPIEDLPADWQTLASSELPSLVTVWQEQADRLRTSGEFKIFMTKLRREIAIETGIIEQLYDLDRGITRLLIEQGINEALIPHGATNRPVKQVVALIQSQAEAVEGLFDFVGGQRTLSTSYIKQLHQVLTQPQETIDALVPATGQIIVVPWRRGDWKQHPNNPLRPDHSVHEYCPPEHVAAEMDRLIEWHHTHHQQGVPPEVEAAWLHHRFTQIHPFQDSNGRVARCLASLVFIQAGWFPLVVTRDDRTTYITALEQADQDELTQLIHFFARTQKQAFIRSLSVSEQVLAEGRRAQVIITAIANKLKQNPSSTLQQRCQQAESFATQLFEIASQRLQEIAEEIRLSVQNLVNPGQIVKVVSASAMESSFLTIIATKWRKQPSNCNILRICVAITPGYN